MCIFNLVVLLAIVVFPFCDSKEQATVGFKADLSPDQNDFIAQGGIHAPEGGAKKLAHGGDCQKEKNSCHCYGCSNSEMQACCGDDSSSDDDDGGCFAATSQVEEKTRGHYTKVVGWLHKNEFTNSTDFMAISYVVGEAKRTLTVTGNHHVRIISGALVEAQDLKIGSKLMGKDGTARKVLEIEYLDSLVGVYAPLTASGTVTVDGIQCSNYVNGPRFEWFMHLCTWPWRSGWLRIPEDTDLYNMHGWISGFYLNTVQWLKTSGSSTEPFSF